MPTKRTRRPRLRIDEPVPTALREYLATGKFPRIRSGAEAQADWWRSFMHWGVYELEREAWGRIGEAMLAHWQVEAPGHRPFAWWKFSAPRWSRDALPTRLQTLGEATLRELPAPRQRLGGIGTPTYEALNIVPELPFGCPVRWVSRDDVAYSNGRALDVHGRPIGRPDYHDGYFPYAAIDPNDPPVFESQAAYLLRHQLLPAGERDRLAPDALQPERVTVIEAARPGRIVGSVGIH